MTLRQAANALQMTTKGVIYRIKTGKVKARKVYGVPGSYAHGYVYDVQLSGNGNGVGATLVARLERMESELAALRSIVGVDH